MKKAKPRGILVYLCPTCGKRFEAHVYGDAYEKKQLFCISDGSIMNCTLEVSGANSEAKRA